MKKIKGKKYFAIGITKWKDPSVGTCLPTDWDKSLVRPTTGKIKLEKKLYLQVRSIKEKDLYGELMYKQKGFKTKSGKGRFFPSGTYGMMLLVK